MEMYLSRLCRRRELCWWHSGLADGDNTGAGGWQVVSVRRGRRRGEPLHCASTGVYHLLLRRHQHRLAAQIQVYIKLTVLSLDYIIA